MNARARPARVVLAALAALAAVVFAALAPIAAAVSPPRGSDAPPISLNDLNATRVETAKLAPRIQVLIFGELGQDPTKHACGEALDALADPRLAAEQVIPILIVAQDGTPALLRDEVSRGRYPAVVLHDRQRDAFGAYRVLVIPTIVVVDPKGKVVHAFPGFLPRFKEILADSVLFAAGKIPSDQFEKTIDPKSATPDPDAQRAARLVSLGRELARHALDDMAEARFSEALRLAPANTDAKLGLASLALKRDQLPEAESLFRSVLSALPDSLDAAIGLANVHLKRGGEDLSKAEAAARAILEKNPKEPKARFLLGQVHERKGDLAQAAAEFKKAAEILLDRSSAP